MSEYHALVARWERNKRKRQQTSYMEDTNQSSLRIRQAFVCKHLGRRRQTTSSYEMNVLTTVWLNLKYANFFCSSITPKGAIQTAHSKQNDKQMPSEKLGETWIELTK